MATACPSGCSVEENKQRSKVLELESQGDMHRAAALRRRLDSPPVAELQTDIAALALELERCYGDTKRMPTRAELRSDNRFVCTLQRCSAQACSYMSGTGNAGLTASITSAAHAKATTVP